MVRFKDEIEVNELSDSRAWYVANLKHSGFYRVNYDLENLQKLIEVLKTDRAQIDSTSRATLIDDTFNLGVAELLNASYYLELVAYIKDEDDSLPLLVALNGLDYVYQMMVNEYEAFEAFKSFFIKLFKSSYDRLDWNENLDDVNDM